MNETPSDLSVAPLKKIVAVNSTAKSLFEYYLTRERNTSHFTFFRLRRHFKEATKKTLTREDFLSVFETVQALRLGILVDMPEGDFKFNWKVNAVTLASAVLDKKIPTKLARKSWAPLVGASKKGNAPTVRPLVYREASPPMYERAAPSIEPMQIEDASNERPSIMTIKNNGYEFQGTLDQWNSPAMAAVRRQIEGKK
jgi:hypothetical protein